MTARSARPLEPDDLTPAYRKSENDTLKKVGREELLEVFLQLSIIRSRVFVLLSARQRTVMFYQGGVLKTVLDATPPSL